VVVAAAGVAVALVAAAEAAAAAVAAAEEEEEEKEKEQEEDEEEEEVPCTERKTSDIRRGGDGSSKRAWTWVRQQLMRSGTATNDQLWTNAGAG
jgi:hypothetical protein